MGTTEPILETYLDLPARRTMARTLVIFAHWDAQNVVDPYVAHYLKALDALDVSILFISSCPTLTPESVDRIRPLCSGIYTRENISFDFGSWHQGLCLIGENGWSLNDFDRLVLTNDTLFGPLFLLDEMWNTFHGADMYGALESWEQAPHLQSFFLAFDLSRHTTRFLNDFWGEYEHLDKYSGVQRYEIGFSAAARDASLRLKPFISLEEAKAACMHSPAGGYYDHLAYTLKNQVNHSLVYWDVLIEYARFPFLKNKIFRLLPGFVGPWHPTETWQDSMIYLKELIEQHTAYPFELIASNVERLGLAPEGFLTAGPAANGAASAIRARK